MAKNQNWDSSGEPFQKSGSEALITSGNRSSNAVQNSPCFRQIDGIPNMKADVADVRVSQPWRFCWRWRVALVQGLFVAASFTMQHWMPGYCCRVPRWRHPQKPWFSRGWKHILGHLGAHFITGMGLLYFIVLGALLINSSPISGWWIVLVW